MYNIKRLGIIISLVMLLFLKGTTFWIHFTSLVIFHVINLNNYYFDSPFNENSIEETWEIENKGELLLLIIIPFFAIIKKLVLLYKRRGEKLISFSFCKKIII